MKILLILPAPVRIKYNISGVYPLPPLGLAYIAAVLEKNGFDVKILDMAALGIQLKDLPSYLEGYTIYGISCNIFNLINGAAIAGIIKEANPSSIVVMGGRCTAFPPEHILKRFSNIDFIISGEGEEAMLNLCCALRDGKDMTCIRNLSFRNGDSVTDNPLGPFIDLNKLPFPARHLLPNKRYRMHPPFGIYPPITIMETSRGCNYGCIFCSLPGEVRERSIENIIDEIELVIGKWGIREIHFVDPNFTYNQQKNMELCNRIIKGNIKINWTCKTRVDLVSEDLLKLMSKAGCYMISFGLESGSQEILDILNKDTEIHDIENAFGLSKKAGIRTIAYVLLGSPGETKDTLKQTVDLVDKVSPDFVLYGELLPDPSSPLIRNSIENKLIDFNKLFDLYINNSHGLFFKRNVYDISNQNIDYWLKYANSKFYFKPRYIIKRLLSLKNFNEIIILVKGMIFLLRDKILGDFIKNINGRPIISTSS